jgi:hypothetical protein
MTLPLGWRQLPGERSELYTHVGLRLVDDLTGQAPIGRVVAELDVAEGTGWQPTDVKPVVGASGTLAYVDLDRSASPVGSVPRRFRVRLTTEFYRPAFRATADGLEFDAYPYNDANPPFDYARQAQRVHLLPSAAYPFPSHVPVLRGQVLDPALRPVADVRVRRGNQEEVLTDDQGVFGLPLRWAAPGAASIDAHDERNNRTQTIQVTLPADLQQVHRIVLP